MLPCCVSAEQILNIIVFETYTTFSFVRFVSVSMQVHKNAGLKSHVQFDFLFWGDESHFVIFNIFLFCLCNLMEPCICFIFTIYL